MPISTIDCSDPMYSWKTITTNNGTSMTNLDLSALTNSINITPSNITMTYNGITNQEEYIEKLEKHIDELEEDIDYFNKQLEEKNEMIHYLLDKNNDSEHNISNMNSHIIYLEARLQALEDKISK